MAQIVTITNPLTGQPAQVDQLDHTAQQIDDGVNAAGIESADYPGCYYRMVGGVVEWLNPPMILDIEYRTTERHNGKPVYVKLFDFGALPNATMKEKDTKISIAYRIIDRAVYSINPGGYEIVDMNRFELEDRLDKGSASWTYRVISTSDYSAYTKTYVTFKYTKD